MKQLICVCLMALLFTACGTSAQLPVSYDRTVTYVGKTYPESTKKIETFYSKDDVVKSFETTGYAEAIIYGSNIGDPQKSWEENQKRLDDGQKALVALAGQKGTDAVVIEGVETVVTNNTIVSTIHKILKATFIKYK